MMPKTCPSCSKPASGRFCSHCGTAVAAAGVSCRECGSQVPAGGRFCNQCGADARASAVAPMAAASTPGGVRAVLPWAVTGVAVLALGALLLYPRLTADSATEAGMLASATSARPAMQGGAVDLASLSPREAADRLFNRVMQSVSTGDSLQAETFLPMAISAYEMVPELDDDGHYHAGVLNIVAASTEAAKPTADAAVVSRHATAARAHADVILGGNASHLFGLSVAAQSEDLLGRPAEARALYRRLLEAYDTEVTRPLPEYQDHQAVLEPTRQEARAYVGG
jgi:hypothetical protein